MTFALFGSIPWLLPGLLLAFVLGLLSARWVSGHLRSHPMVAWLMIVGLGLVFSATLTPLRGAIENGTVGTGACDLSGLWPLSPSSWFTFGDRPMNILMFLPLGLAIGLIPRSPTKIWLVIVATVMPFALESVQLLVPILGRGCEGIDLVDNLTGLLLGLGVGSVVGRFVAQPRPVSRVTCQPPVRGTS
jgi:glycopeptide antibiotics resistance protein